LKVEVPNLGKKKTAPMNVVCINDVHQGTFGACFKGWILNEYEL
jgi:hypothetical protein